MAKRFLALVLSCVMLMSLCAPALAAEATGTNMEETPVGADAYIDPMEEVTLTTPTLGAGAATSGSCGVTGADVRWSFDTGTGTLTISGTGAMMSFEKSRECPWYTYANSITKVVVSSGVTSTGDSAFASLKT